MHILLLLVLLGQAVEGLTYTKGKSLGLSMSLTLLLRKIYRPFQQTSSFHILRMVQQIFAFTGHTFIQITCLLIEASLNSHNVSLPLTQKFRTYLHQMLASVINSTNSRQSAAL